MNRLSHRGVVAETRVVADLVSRGHLVSLPIGQDTRYDLIADRNGKLERIQVKYAESNGETINVKCYACFKKRRYTPADVDWIAVFDATTDRCYYVPSRMLGVEGRTGLTLRLLPTTVKFRPGFLHWATDFTEF